MPIETIKIKPKIDFINNFCSRMNIYDIDLSISLVGCKKKICNLLHTCRMERYNGMIIMLEHGHRQKYTDADRKHAFDLIEVVNREPNIDKKINRKITQYLMIKSAIGMMDEKVQVDGCIQIEAYTYKNNDIDGNFIGEFINNASHNQQFRPDTGQIDAKITLLYEARMVNETHNNVYLKCSFLLSDLVAVYIAINNYETSDRFVLTEIERRFIKNKLHTKIFK